ncbi:MAG: aminodeoxychorismate synthase component I [Candidatus Eisenbacteria bacterium]|nr:aminodeoxychorismate synthase component I [Candidatus Eisenbacteria bacterium]
MRDPLTALRALARLPHPFLLHSALAGARARWSFFGADPFEVHRGGDYAAAVARWRALAAGAAHGTGGAHSKSGAPAPLAAGAGQGGADPAPFTGGAVGYWAYDFGRRLERLPARAADDLGLPDFLLGFYDVVGAFDHASGECRLYSSGLPLEGTEGAERAQRRLESFAATIESAPPAAAAAPGGAPLHARSTFRADDYLRAVERVKDHIRRGDIFQANLSQRWTLPLAGDALRLALPLFGALARLSPAPFAAFVGAEDHAIVSASPERFLELSGGRIETRPIKGTRPRAADLAEDARLASELLASAKDRAENVMIVDVLRNDLGRVCETGSVATSGLCELESFPQVHHLTSTVTGVLRGGLDGFDLLAACFPGGSITGAPKIRAMEILDALEPVRRHIYTGAVGWLDWRGEADWNIAIRTALVTSHAFHFAAGGGITADSDPTAEYEETLHKAEGMRAALAAVAGPVTLAPALAGVR